MFGKLKGNLYTAQFVEDFVFMNSNLLRHQYK